jgi:5'-3' exonuclease
MGVPLLFKYFARLCPEAVRDKPPASSTHLYIDFNNVIHNCARLPGIASEDDVIAASVENVRSLINEFKPTDAIFVAVDGVPPRAKMVQQRSRRYAGSVEDVDVDEEKAQPKHQFSWWNSCVVTPGTAFMRRLSAALHSEFWSGGGGGGGGGSATVIVSDASEPGEGEQKLFRHLSRAPANASTCAIICGMDADLIVMGLVAATLRGQHVHIARDASTFVDVNLLATRIHEKVMKAATPSASIRNFVAMLALLGNDFVPSLPGLSISHGGIEALARLSRQSQLVVEHSKSDIDIRALQAMLVELSSSEGNAVRLAESRSHASNDNMVRSTVSPGAPGWRPRYNQRVFGQSHPDVMREICNAYIAGIVWNATYMIEQQTLSEGFSYAWTYAPTAHDLAMVLATDTLALEVPRYLERTSDSDRGARFACGATPEAWQLCHVLPPSQAHLLLEGGYDAMHRVMTDARFGALHFYPSGFSRSTYLVPANAPAHVSTPILPMFDDQVLANAIILASAEMKTTTTTMTSRPPHSHSHSHSHHAR